MQREDLIDPNAVEALTITDRATGVVDGEHQAFSVEPHAGPFTSGAEAIPRNSGDKVVVMRRTALDRAAVAATALMQIFATAQGPELRQTLEDYLRDELADVKHQAIADREAVNE
jgi:hypothetical protein